MGSSGLGSLSQQGNNMKQESRVLYVSPTQATVQVSLRPSIAACSLLSTSHEQPRVRG